MDTFELLLSLFFLKKSMHNKLNDLYQNLEKKINMRNIFSLSRAKAIIFKSKGTTKDMYNTLSKRVDVSRTKYVKVFKNTTRNFDALRKKWLKNDIIVVKKKYDWLNKFFFYYSEKWYKNFSKKLKELSHNPKALFFSFIFFLFLYFFSWYFLIENRVNSGFQKIVSLKDSSFSIDNIKKITNSSERDFEIASFFFLPYQFFQEKKFEDAHHIIKWGLSITKTIKDFYGLYDASEKFINEKGIKEIMFSQLLENIHPAFEKIIQDGEKILQEFWAVHDIWNLEIQKKIDEQVKNLELVLKYLKNFDANYTTFLDLFGHTKEKKYLVIFQNSDEIRPTGGFMGSMGIVSLFRGKVKSFEKNDVYAYEWNLKRQNLEKIPAPEWINKLTDNFGLRDANYFIDTKESAEKIKFFMEKSGYQIDGIIFLNQNLILELLDVIGGVKYKAIGEIITSDNFSEIMSLLVESKVRKEGSLGSPKQALFDFIDDFSKKILQKKRYKEYLAILWENIKKREIIFYSFTQKENDFLQSLGLDGNIIYPKTLDFSSPVFTSISGNKSDRYIKRSFEKEVKINADCSIFTKMKIIQKHSFTKGNEDFLYYTMNKFGIENQDYLLWIQGKWANFQYIRVIIPNDALVEKSKNIVVEKDEQKQSINFYLKTDVGQESSFDINYSIPNPSCKKYDFTFLKQAGIKEYNIKIHTNKEWIEKKGVKEDFVYKWEK